MTAGIYTITCSTTGRKYVGSSVDIERRWSQHKKALDRGRHPNRRLQQAWKKYPESVFLFDVVQICGEDILRVIEREYIVRYNSVVKGFNGTYETEVNKPATIRTLKFNKKGVLLNRCLSKREKGFVKANGQLNFMNFLQKSGVTIRRVHVET